MNPNEVKIGYLRKPLAQVITARLAAGSQATAEIAYVLPEEFYPERRLNIGVRLVPNNTEILVVRIPRKRKQIIASK